MVVRAQDVDVEHQRDRGDEGAAMRLGSETRAFRRALLPCLPDDAMIVGPAGLYRQAVQELG